MCGVAWACLGIRRAGDSLPRAHPPRASLASRPLAARGRAGEAAAQRGARCTERAGASFSRPGSRAGGGSGAKPTPPAWGRAQLVGRAANAVVGRRVGVRAGPDPRRGVEAPSGRCARVVCALAGLSLAAQDPRSRGPVPQLRRGLAAALESRGSSGPEREAEATSRPPATCPWFLPRPASAGLLPAALVLTAAFELETSVEGRGASIWASQPR